MSQRVPSVWSCGARDPCGSEAQVLSNSPQVHVGDLYYIFLTCMSFSDMVKFTLRFKSYWILYRIYRNPDSLKRKIYKTWMCNVHFFFFSNTPFSVPGSTMSFYLFLFFHINIRKIYVFKYFDTLRYFLHIILINWYSIYFNKSTSNLNNQLLTIVFYIKICWYIVQTTIYSQSTDIIIYFIIEKH